MSERLIFDRKHVIRILLTVLLIATLLIIFWGQGSKQVLLEFQDHSMILSAPEEESFRLSIAYTDIFHMELLSEFDFGNCISGTDLEDHKNGHWTNDAFGDYTLCIYVDIPAYILLDTVEGTVVFNYESSDTTQQLFHALAEHIDTKTAEAR